MAKAQQDWDTPEGQIPPSRESSAIQNAAPRHAESQPPESHNGEADAHLRRHHRWIAALTAVAMLVAGASGFAWRRYHQGGSALNCSHQTGLADAQDYCFGGFKPLQPSGDRLAPAEAGRYFAATVDDTYAADDTVRLAAAGGDTDAVNKAAATARDLSQRAAETLAARTWPESLDKPIRMVIIEYQERASIYGNLCTNRNAEAIDWMTFDEFRPSGAQQLIRTSLDLPGEPEPAIPVSITGIRDDGECPDRILDGNDEVEVTRRCFTVTASNRTNADISGIILDFNVLGGDDTIRGTGASAISSTPLDGNGDLIEHGGIKQGDTVALTMRIDPELLRDGDRFAPSGWSEAGAYYLDAIEPSIRPFDAALAASFSGDLAATRNAAADAAKALRATAATLRSRTWPESVANAAATIADNYADRARKADYVASAVGSDAGDELTQLDAYRVSEADAYLRGKLGLPAAAAPAVPLEIVRIEDHGIQQGPDTSGSSVDKGKRVIAMTVRSHVPGTLTGLNLSFRLKHGKSAVGRAWGIVHDIALAEGQSIVVTIPLDADGVPSGDTAPGGALAGSRLIWDGLSLTDARGADHQAAADASYAASNPDPVLDAFVLR